MTHPRIVVYGASDHGKVVADAVRESRGGEVIGFIDDDRRKWGESIGGHPVLGGLSALDSIPAVAAIALGVGANEERMHVLERLLARGETLATVVHPSAAISGGAKLGAGTFVGPCAVVHVNARVGRGAIINSGAIVEHDDVIGDFAHVSPNAVLGGRVTIGEGAHVGLGAAILPGLSVGEWARVGAGAVVISAVPPKATAVGVPARLLGERGESAAPAAPKRLHLSAPHMGGAELGLVREAFENNWLAPVGPHIEAFEREFCEATGAPYAAALSSGTAALHLAVLLAGVGPGDEVLCSTLTFAASANPILYAGARPVFIDSDRASWNMDPALAVEEIESAARRGRPPKAVILVHLYGQSADVDPIAAACKRHGIALIEDAAEALGATYKGRAPGTLGAAGIFSFNGNKIITTSGGGMLVSPDRAFIEKARFLATQARDPAPHYEHSHVGYNYRLSNVLAGIGRGQLRVLADRVARRRRIFELYREALGGIPGVDLMPEAPFGSATRWLSVVTIDPERFGATREEIRQHLDRSGVEARPVWKPMHAQPVFRGCRTVGGAVADDLFARGLCLPSGSQMTRADVQRVVEGFLSTPGRSVTRRARDARVEAT